MISGPFDWDGVERCVSWSEGHLVQSDRDPKVKYVVVISSVLDGFPSCTCAAFEYSREVPPTCKHCKRARQGACLWNAADGPASEEIGVCPKCGSPTEVVRHSI